MADVRSFLGAAGYFHEHIPNFAATTAPLRALLKKGVKFEWSEACQQAFETLKTQLVSSDCLRMPHLDKAFILTTDWSKVAVGAVLSQKQAVVPDDPSSPEREYIIAYASRALTSAQSNYAPTEGCLLYTSPSPRDRQKSRMPSSA